MPSLSGVLSGYGTGTGTVYLYRWSGSLPGISFQLSFSIAETTSSNLGWPPFPHASLTWWFSKTSRGAPRKGWGLGPWKSATPIFHKHHSANSKPTWSKKSKHWRPEWEAQHDEWPGTPSAGRIEIVCVNKRLKKITQNLKLGCLDQKANAIQ